MYDSFETEKQGSVLLLLLKECKKHLESHSEKCGTCHGSLCGYVSRIYQRGLL
ncbi:hypothetical protein [Neobacillus sp.]|uniref:hypothetical protein n=1 Tax=Neobacillus sp. TaxID=2675273 RepID=UPI0037C7CFBA